MLSFGIPFALVPMILITRRRDIMGALANRPQTTAIASVVAALIIGLNGFLVYQTMFGLSDAARGRVVALACPTQPGGSRCSACSPA